MAEPIENLRLSLRTCWFLRYDTHEATFAALLGDDVRRLAADGRLRDLAHGPLHHRARHVLEDSGTVSWAFKEDVLRAAATVDELRPAVLYALMAGYHAVYGNLEPAAALDLLDRVTHNAEGVTEDVTKLRKVLRLGARNHYRDPALWDA